MGLFDKLRDKKDKEDANAPVDGVDVTDNTESIVETANTEGTVDSKNSDDVYNDDNVYSDDTENDTVVEDSASEEDGAIESGSGDFYEGTLQEEIVDAIGQGSEDVKNYVVTTKDGNEIKFVVSGGVIKQVTAEEGLNVPARLAWTDGNKFSQEELDSASEYFENEDYFDALTKLVSDEELSQDAEGIHGQELAAIISEAHKEESVRTLARFADAEVESIDLDWAVDSDADVIEAYGGFALDPLAVEALVEAFNYEVGDRLDRLEVENLIYPTSNTDYDLAESDEERYVIAAVFSEYQNRTSDEPGASGTDVSALLQYAHGFSVIAILDAVSGLLEKDFLSYEDPFAEEVEEEEEVIEEPVDDSFLDVSDIDTDIEEDEPVIEDEPEDDVVSDMEDIARDNFAPYPAAIEGGTENLGGALVHYINELRAQDVFTSADDSKVEYNIGYNTLYEESIQTVEFSLRHVVNSLEASKRIYGGFETIGGQSTDKVSKNSNLYRAAYLIETERNELNSSRIPILKDLRDLLLDIRETPSEIVTLAVEEIDKKLDAIADVSDVVMGEGAAQFISLEDNEYNPETTPIFYEVARELGVSVA